MKELLQNLGTHPISLTSVTGLHELIAFMFSAVVAWDLSLLQGLYLFVAFIVAEIRREAYTWYDQQLARKVYKSRTKWVPLTPNL